LAAYSGVAGFVREPRDVVSGSGLACEARICAILAVDISHGCVVWPERCSRSYPTNPSALDGILFTVARRNVAGCRE